MLLRKVQKRINMFYLLSLFGISLLFYYNLFAKMNLSSLIDYNSFLSFLLTPLFLLCISFIYSNTYDKKIKYLVLFVYIVILVLIFSNKIYMYFFNDYLSFQRASMFGILPNTGSILYDALTSIQIIFLFICIITNIVLFFKSRFKLKHYRKIMISTFGIYFIMVLVSGLANYEIVSYSITSFFSGSSTNIYEKKYDVYDSLKNKEIVTNEYTGVAKDKNLIIIQCESLQSIFLNRTYNDKEILPNLNSLINEDSLYFKNYFTQVGWGNTSDAEFITLNSFYPVIMESVYSRFPKNYYRGVTKLLRENGYYTSAFHGYLKEFWNREIMYKAIGFDKFYSSDYYSNGKTIGWGVCDVDFLDTTASYLKELPVPFGAFIITLTSHVPFDTTPDMSDIELLSKHENTLFGRYIQNINYLDSAIGGFIEKLKVNGLYENSIIAIYGDHQGLNISVPENVDYMTEYLGKPYLYDDMLGIPFIIHMPGLIESKTIDTTCGQIDFLPTILNIMGINNDTIYFGEDILNIAEDSDRGIGGTAFMPLGSFINKDFIFLTSVDSILENSKIYLRSSGKEVKSNLTDRLYNISKELMEKIKLSNSVTEKNLIKPILDNNIIALNNVIPQFLVCNFNYDTDHYDYSERLKSVIKDGYNLLSTKVYYRNEIFYISNALNVENEMTLIDFLKEVSKQKDVYVILTGTADFTLDLFRILGRENPDLATIVIPELYKLEDYQNIRVFNMNTPILCVDELTKTNEEIVNFISANELFAISISKRNFNSNLVKRIVTLNKFIYVKDVNDEGELIFYTNIGISGFYTDSLTYKKGLSSIKK